MTERKIAVALDKYIDSSFITVIKSDKNDEVEAFLTIKKYFEQNSDSLCMRILRISDIDGTIFAKRDIVFVIDYIFSEENDLLIRGLYDSMTVSKIFLLPKISFDYSQVSTHLSGRIDICFLYFDSYKNQNSNYSFNDYFYMRKLSEDKRKKFNDLKNDICRKFNSRLNEKKLNAFLLYFVKKIGQPLSKFKIGKEMSANGDFIHNDILSNLLTELIETGILLQCNRYDMRRNVEVHTNIYYFFKDMDFLMDIVVNQHANSFDNLVIQLNGIFLELYFSSLQINFIETANDSDCYLFALDGVGNNSSLVGLMNEIKIDTLQSLTKEMYKINPFNKKYIIANSCMNQSIYSGIPVETIEAYLGGEKHD